MGMNIMGFVHKLAAYSSSSVLCVCSQLAYLLLGYNPNLTGEGS